MRTSADDLGIECMQLAVIACVMPVLILLSRTSAYGLVRYSGAAAGTIAALGWVLAQMR